MVPLVLISQGHRPHQGWFGSEGRSTLSMRAIPGARSLQLLNPYDVFDGIPGKRRNTAIRAPPTKQMAALMPIDIWMP